MPERGFDTAFWSDPFVQKLPSEGKFLYSYLWTNAHCNPAGLYEITLETIAFETKLPVGDIPKLLQLLKPKVSCYEEENLIWVKNFIKRQSKSPKFLQAAAKCLTLIHNNGAVNELLNYNLEKYSISIPYQYYIDKLLILTRASASASDTDTVSDKGKEVKGEGELSDILKCLMKVKGWQADEDDIHWLQGLRGEFPGFTLAEFKACVDYHSGRAPPKHKGIWKNRFRNWMIKKQEFAEARIDSGQKGMRRVEASREAKEFEEKW